MVQVRVLYFAAARDAAARREEVLDLPDGATLQELMDEVVRRHPAMARLRSALRVAVDERYADPGHRLQGTEEVAIIPPVAGGSTSTKGLIPDGKA